MPFLLKTCKNSGFGPSPKIVQDVASMLMQELGQFEAHFVYRILPAESRGFQQKTQHMAQEKGTLGPDIDATTFMLYTGGGQIFEHLEDRWSKNDDFWGGCGNQILNLGSFGA